MSWLMESPYYTPLLGLKALSVSQCAPVMQAMMVPSRRYRNRSVVLAGSCQSHVVLRHHAPVNQQSRINCGIRKLTGSSISGVCSNKHGVVNCF